MSLTAIVINGFAVLCLGVSALKDPPKTLRALRAAFTSFIGIFPAVMLIVILIGILMGFISSETIAGFIGESAGMKGVLLAAIFGSLVHIPALIGFPLTASLIESGASITSAAVFITTLTMIGVVTLPLEVKEMGKKFAFLRNSLSFIGAFIIALIMGAVL